MLGLTIILEASKKKEREYFNDLMTKLFLFSIDE